MMASHPLPPVSSPSVHLPSLCSSLSPPFTFPLFSPWIPSFLSRHLFPSHWFPLKPFSPHPQLPSYPSVSLGAPCQAQCPGKGLMSSGSQGLKQEDLRQPYLYFRLETTTDTLLRFTVLACLCVCLSSFPSFPSSLPLSPPSFLPNSSLHLWRLAVAPSNTDSCGGARGRGKGEGLRRQL